MSSSESKKLKMVNLWAGPGAGKSTTGAGTFFLAKLANWKIELITEYAKECTYKEQWELLSTPEGQEHIFAVQSSRASMLVGKTEWAITDSPILLSNMYGTYCTDEFKDKVVQEHNLYTNIDIFINRVKPYQKYGRSQEEYEARELDEKLKILLHGYGIKPYVVDGDKYAPEKILAYLESFK